MCFLLVHNLAEYYAGNVVNRFMHASKCRMQMQCAGYVFQRILVYSCFIVKAALADDVGKHVEEILGYIHYTVKVDPSGGLLCVQQVAT